MRPGRPLANRAHRTTLAPGDLIYLVDRLVANPHAIWTVLGLDPSNPNARSASPEEIGRLIDILDDARILELSQAPSLGSVLRAGGSLAVAVAGLGIGMAAPIGSVIAAFGLAFGGASGLFASWDAARLIRQDLSVGDRLRAIELAKTTLLGIILA